MNYNGRDSFARQYNWFAFFCDKLPEPAVSRKLVAECASSTHRLTPTLSGLVCKPTHARVAAAAAAGDRRRTRCFTSFDSNWSNNPFIINRQYIFNGEKVRQLRM